MKFTHILQGCMIASRCMLSGGARPQVVAKFAGSTAVKRGPWQHRISSWIVSIFLALGTTAVQAQIPAGERAVLLNFYASTNGATWTTGTNWNGPAGTECTWFGVTCGGGTVTGINLDFNNLTGSLPGNLNNLPSLTNFSVQTNQLTGPIPSLTGLTNLQLFRVYGNQLSGPIPALTGLTNLQVFLAGANQLTGSIPALTGLTKLNQFFVNSNQLTGSIPALTGLTSLTSFYAGGNQLTGSIPALTGLTNLDHFYVNSNQLTGSIPALTGLTKLVAFSVGGNQLSGNAPAVPSPSALVAGGSQLCPNYLNHIADPAWDAATGMTPWYTNCAPAGTTVTISSGSGQSTRVGTAFPLPLVALVKDGNGNPVSGLTVSWTVPALGASATSVPASTITDGGGLATVAPSANAISGTYAVTASVGAQSADFGLTNAITIAVGTACSGNAATNADLVEQYYAAILRRPSDAGGKAFWISEADRLCALGVDPKETFYLLANSFYNSPEYLGFNRDDASFVTDLYISFFSRLPDVGGLDYWLHQIISAMPRNIVMSSFLFSPEFTATMNGVFPGRTARAETYLVMNLYGGLFRRLADSGGYTYWDGQFRTAQCNASPATAVRTTIDSVSSLFVASDEYKARNTTDSQYVQDLYYAMLQRGGDLTGFNFWVGQLSGKAMTRSQVRQQFLTSPEMTAQSVAIAGQGCLP